jgi:hypothetical protein
VPISTKVCPKCQRELALITTNFRKLRKSAYCRECERVYSRKYVQSHRDQINAARAVARAKQREEAATMTENHDMLLRELQRDAVEKRGLIDPITGEEYPPEQAKDMI